MKAFSKAMKGKRRSFPPCREPAAVQAGGTAAVYDWSRSCLSERAALGQDDWPR